MKRLWLSRIFNETAKNERGFTLIEIMVVLIIIAGMAYLVAPNVIGMLGKSKIQTTGVQIKNIESSLKLFKLDQGFYPETQQGLDALIAPPSGGRLAPKPYPEGGYLEGGIIPLDAWGFPYYYVGSDQAGGMYEIISGGPDAQFPSDDDISSRQILQ